MEQSFQHLSLENSVEDILNHPAFQGFSDKILPWDDMPEQNISLRQIGRLMPYHGNIIPEEVLRPLNKLIDEIESGHQVFYNIYPDRDTRQQHTGLFFFRGKKDAPFAIIFPGGGFSYVGSLHEGFPLALALSRKGYNAFVLKYRTGSPDAAMQDLSCAMEYIFTHQNDLKISVNGYSAWGGSAGARMAAYLGSYGTKAFGGKELPRPAAVIMGYTGHSDFTRSEPPTFMFVGSEDWIANPEKMRRTAEKLSQSGIEIEFHIYPNLGHGFGLGTGTSAEGWLDKATSFWQKHLPPSLEIPNINPSQTSDQQ